MRPVSVDHGDAGDLARQHLLFHRLAVVAGGHHERLRVTGPLDEAVEVAAAEDPASDVAVRERAQHASVVVDHDQRLAPGLLELTQRRADPGFAGDEDVFKRRVASTSQSTNALWRADGSRANALMLEAMRTDTWPSPKGS